MTEDTDTHLALNHCRLQSSITAGFNHLDNLLYRPTADGTIVALSRRREQSGLTILDTHEHLTSRTNQQLSILTHLSERNAELVTVRSEIKYSG